MRVCVSRAFSRSAAAATTCAWVDASVDSACAIWSVVCRSLEPQRGLGLAHLRREPLRVLRVVGVVGLELVRRRSPRASWSFLTASPSLTSSCAIWPAICGLTMTSLVVTMPVSTSVDGGRLK